MASLDYPSLTLSCVWCESVLKQRILKTRTECKRGMQRLDEILRKRQKKFKPEELQTTNDSVYKLKDNIRIIGDLFED